MKKLSWSKSSSDLKLQNYRLFHWEVFLGISLHSEYIWLKSIFCNKGKQLLKRGLTVSNVFLLFLFFLFPSFSFSLYFSFCLKKLCKKTKKNVTKMPIVISVIFCNIAQQQNFDKCFGPYSSSHSWSSGIVSLPPFYLAVMVMIFLNYSNFHINDSGDFTVFYRLLLSMGTW